MSLKTNIIIDQAALDDIKNKLTWIADGSSRGAGRVVVRALNTTAGRGQRMIRRNLGVVVNLPQGEIGKFIRVGKATYSKQENNVLTRARPLSLSRFPTKQTASGVEAKVFRGGAPVSIKSAFIANSRVRTAPQRGVRGFVARVFGAQGATKQGGLLVFRRRGKARLPLDVMRADDMVKIMNDRAGGFEPVAEKMLDDLSSEVNRGIHFELLKADRAARKSLL